VASNRIAVQLRLAMVVCKRLILVPSDQPKEKTQSSVCTAQLLSFYNAGKMLATAKLR